MDRRKPVIGILPTSNYLQTDDPFKDTYRYGNNYINRIVENGDTVLVIEHNLDVIKVADYIIDLGPEGGSGGGLVVATGTPEDIIKVKESHTGRFLKNILK